MDEPATECFIPETKDVVANGSCEGWPTFIKVQNIIIDAPYGRESSV